MSLFQDASTYRWIPGFDRDLDLVAVPDDATGAIYSAIIVEREGTASSFFSLAETIAKKSIFRALYTDRGSHYFHMPKAGGKVDKTHLSQVSRALQRLGVTHILSYSPEARGRMERVLVPLQKRLPQELRLMKITTICLARFDPTRNPIKGFTGRITPLGAPGNHSSGHLMCYEGRTSSRATDSLGESTSHRETPTAWPSRWR